MRWLLLLLLLLLVTLQYQLWFRGGMNDVWELEKALEVQRAENDVLRKRNDALAAEVDDLKRGQDAIEERARSELGMIKEGEKLIQVAEPRRAAAAAAAHAEEPRE
ncbi:MAG: cell division protein FtsB [Lysobacterales bacterium]